MKKENLLQKNIQHIKTMLYIWLSKSVEENQRKNRYNDYFNGKCASVRKQVEEALEKFRVERYNNTPAHDGMVISYSPKKYIKEKHHPDEFSVWLFRNFNNIDCKYFKGVGNPITGKLELVEFIY